VTIASTEALVRQASVRGAHIVLVVMVLVCYIDLGTDVGLAFYLLGTPQAVFGIVSLGIVGACLFLQACDQHFLFHAPRKDVLITAIGLGPALVTYREVMQIPPVSADAAAVMYHSNLQIVATLKGAEVMLESMPEAILKLNLLIATPLSEWQPFFVVSLGTSVVAAGLILTEMEAMYAGELEPRRRLSDYHQYLPEAGARRVALLVLNMLFVGGYFAFVSSSAVLAFRAHRAMVWGVLVTDCALFHALKASAGEWGIDAFRMPRAINAMFTSFSWIIFRFCPVWTFRLPQFVGPRHAMRTVVCGLVESTCFVGVSLYAAEDSPTREQEVQLLWGLCVPAGCVAFVGLVGLLLVMEERYRAFFWKDDPRGAFLRRLWARDGYAPGDLDRSRAILLTRQGHPSALRKRCPEVVRAWLEEGLPRWHAEQPEWFTREWWEGIPAPLREGLAFAPADLSA